MGPVSATLPLRELVVRFLHRAERKYRRVSDGSPTREAANYRAVLNRFLAHCEETLFTALVVNAAPGASLDLEAAVEGWQRHVRTAVYDAWPDSPQQPHAEQLRREQAEAWDALAESRFGISDLTENLRFGLTEAQRQRASRFCGLVEALDSGAARLTRPMTEKISAGLVRRWMEQMALEPSGRQSGVTTTLSRGYINACLTKLRTVVGWAADLDLIPYEVKDQLRRVRRLAHGDATDRPPRLADDADPRRFIADAWASTVYMPRTPRAVCQLLMLTGARVGEFLGAQQGDVRPPDGRALVPPALIPKQHKNAHRGGPKARKRLIPLCMAAWQVIEPLYRPICAGDALFPGEGRGNQRGHYSLAGLQAAITRACKRAGVPRWTPHQVRHAVLRVVRSDGGLDLAQALAGHSTASMTEHYAPVPAAAAFAAIPKLQSLAQEDAPAAVSAARGRAAG